MSRNMNKPNLRSSHWKHCRLPLQPCWASARREEQHAVSELRGSLSDKRLRQLIVLDFTRVLIVFWLWYLAARRQRCTAGRASTLIQHPITFAITCVAVLHAANKDEPQFIIGVSNNSMQNAKRRMKANAHLHALQIAFWHTLPLDMLSRSSLSLVLA